MCINTEPCVCVCGRARGTECHMLSPAEIKDKCPLLNTEDLEGAMWVPGDGVCHPYTLTRTLMQLANGMGQ